ncbi:hypothetical protein F4703DRAFT_1799458 [Phycomyces blakesleeanus]
MWMKKCRRNILTTYIFTFKTNFGLQAHSLYLPCIFSFILPYFFLALCQILRGYLYKALDCMTEKVSETRAPVRLEAGRRKGGEASQTEFGVFQIAKIFASANQKHPFNTAITLRKHAFDAKKIGSRRHKVPNVYTPKDLIKLDKCRNTTSLVSFNCGEIKKETYIDSDVSSPPSFPDNSPRSPAQRPVVDTCFFALAYKRT